MTGERRFRYDPNDGLPELWAAQDRGEAKFGDDPALWAPSRTEEAELDGGCAGAGPVSACDLCGSSGAIWADWVGADGGPGWIDCPLCFPQKVRELAP